MLDRSIVRRSRSDILAGQRGARAAGLTSSRCKLPDASRRAHRPTLRRRRRGPVRDFAADVAPPGARSLRPRPLPPRRRPRPVPSTCPCATTAAAEVAPTEIRASRRTARGALRGRAADRFQSSRPGDPPQPAAPRRRAAPLRRSARAEPPRLLDLQRHPARARAAARRGDRARPRRRRARRRRGPGRRGAGAALARSARRRASLGRRELSDLDPLQQAIAQRPRGGRRAARPAALGRRRRQGRRAASKPSPTHDSRKGAPGLAGRRVLIFSQFRDTARYLHRRLTGRHWPSARTGALIDGTRPRRSARGSPPGLTPTRREADAQARGAGEQAPRARSSPPTSSPRVTTSSSPTRVVNFDLHFNPQVAVQRAGRIDRLDSRHNRSVAREHAAAGAPRSPHRPARLASTSASAASTASASATSSVMPLAADLQGQTLEQIRRLYADDDSVLDEIERSWTLGSTDYMRHPLATFLNAAGARASGRRSPSGCPRSSDCHADWAHGEASSSRSPAPAAGEQRETTGGSIRARGRHGDAAHRRRRDLPGDRLPRVRATRRAHGGPTAPGIFDWDLAGGRPASSPSELTLRALARQSCSEEHPSARASCAPNSAPTSPDSTSKALDDLLERLLQVRVEDFDGRSGWRPSTTRGGRCAAPRPRASATVQQPMSPSAASTCSADLWPSDEDETSPRLPPKTCSSWPTRRCRGTGNNSSSGRAAATSGV